MTIAETLKTTNTRDHAAGMFAFLMSVIRSGETLSADEELEIRQLINQLGAEQRSEEYFELDHTSVGHFHEKFNLDNTTHREAGPREVPQELMDFRVKFMEEELREFKEARERNDIAGMADALVDLSYVTLGTAHVMGLPWQELFFEVQKANMAKERALRAEQSLRGSTYDVVKPKGWQPPDIESVLRKHGWNV
jgi:predicted HAD superfamily Cof-like phosphohydrolase